MRLSQFSLLKRGGGLKGLGGVGEWGLKGLGKEGKWGIYALGKGEIIENEGLFLSLRFFILCSFHIDTPALFTFKGCGLLSCNDA